MLYFIINSASKNGKGKAVWEAVQKELETLSIHYESYHTEHPGHATLLAEEICAKEDQNACLVILGGDGTINEVINGITDFEHIRVGLIPNGSGNDFARGLKLSKDPLVNLEHIIQAIDTDWYRNIDLGRVTLHDVILPNGKTSSTESRLFAISSGAGMDAIVCREVNTKGLKSKLNHVHLGELSYIITTVITLFRMKTLTLKEHLWDADGINGPKGRKKKSFGKVIFTAVMNTPFEGGGVPMAPHASCEDGLLSNCIAWGIPKWQTFLLFPFLITGHHEHIRGFKTVTASMIRMDFNKPACIHADGEQLGEALDAEFDCLPGILHFMQ